MQHPKIDTGSSSPHRREKEHTTSVHVPLMIATEASHGPKIPASEGSPTSHVQADGNDNM